MSSQRDPNDSSTVGRLSAKGSRRGRTVAPESSASAPPPVSSSGRANLDVPGAAPRERKGSWLSSLKRPKRFSFKTSSSSSKSDASRENQVHSYTAWINSYLGKLEDQKQVTDLQTDLSDGLTLVNLIEAVSGQVIANADRQPMTQSARRANTQLVLEFMHRQRVKMHHTSAKDVVDGNLKSIMRLVLALAAHYRPTTLALDAASMSGSAAPSGGGGGSAQDVRLQQQQQQQQQQLQNNRQPHQQYPLYVDQVAVLDNSPRRTRSAATLPPDVSLSGSDPMLRNHENSGIRNHAYKRRSMIQLSPSGSSNAELGLPASVRPDSTSPTSSSGVSDKISPLDPNEVRELLASPGGRKTVSALGVETPGGGQGSAYHRSRSFTELPSARPQNRRSMIEQGSLETTPTLAPLPEGALNESLSRTSQQEQRQLAARELALEGFPTGSVGMSRSNTAPLFASVSLPPRLASQRQKAPVLSPVQPVLSGELLVQHLEMEEDVRSFKEMLFALQHSLLTGLPADLASVVDMMDVPDEVVLLQARLDQKNRAIDRLEEQLVSTEVERDRLKTDVAPLRSGGEGLTTNAPLVCPPSPLPARRSTASSQSPLVEKKFSTGSIASQSSSHGAAAAAAASSVAMTIPAIQISADGDRRGDSATDGFGDDDVDVRESLAVSVREVETLRSELLQMSADKKNKEIAAEEAEREVLEKKETLKLLTDELEERDEEIATLRAELRATNALADGSSTVSGSRPTSVSLLPGPGTPLLPSDSPPLPSERLQGVGADNPDSLPRSRPSSILSFGRRSPPPHLRGLDRMAYNQIGSALDSIAHISKNGKLSEEFSSVLSNAHEELTGALDKIERSAKSPTKRRRSSSGQRGMSPSLGERGVGYGSPSTMRHIVGQEAPKAAQTVSPPPASPAPPPATTLVYFMDQVETPFKTSIPKRSGEVTLRDFKETVDRPGIYRYHFKTVDPEFGTVKEELTGDADDLPLWDGKVVAWIEEDASIV